MGHNKWFVGSLGALVLCAIPGGLEIMWGVLVCVGVAGLCFAKWLKEEEKYQKEHSENF